MEVKIAVKRMTGAVFEETKIISFTFVKDAYIPYTSVTARIYAEEEDYMSVAEIFLYVGDYLVHHGLVDTLEVTETNGVKIATLASRGFTSLLCQNQIEPGMITGISINDLMDSYYELPYVTHEDNSDQSGYIYVKSNSSMWDGVVNLSYKLNKIYPYIRGTNCVRITAESDPSVFSYDESQLTESGLAYNFKRMISNFNMADISGEYGSYTLEDTVVTNRKIVRHKVFELDRQFLSDPQEALNYRDKYANRGHFRYFCRYSGYSGEDLCDMVSFGYAQNKRISRIEIIGDSTGVDTELSVYYDGFYSGGTL
ncbi:MAG: hypothetical protein LIO40_06485 [Ruminococcus sp.]|nr:hypothetical protein [Ruminococcus sp.]